MSSILEDLFGAIQPPRGQKSIAYPMEEAQIATLTELLRHARRAPLLRHGDLVRYVGASGPLTAEARKNLVLMFWRDLADTPDDAIRREAAQPTEVATLPVIDCLVAIFDGRSLTFNVSCKQLLEVVES